MLEFDGVRLAFLGGVEERSDEAAINMQAYRRLMDLGTEESDVVVSHQGPYGSSIGFRGDIHGSPLMTHLIERLQPTFQVAGHAHKFEDLRSFGRTTYLGLDALVASPIWRPEARGLQQGCLATLDTDARILSPVTGDWLTRFPTPFDFDSWLLDFLSL